MRTCEVVTSAPRTPRNVYAEAITIHNGIRTETEQWAMCRGSQHF